MYKKSLDFLGFPNCEVCSNGVIIGAHGHPLKPQEDKNGYLYVCLHFRGKQKNKRVHQLVALAFIDNPHNYTDIDHMDENKQNNNIDNLQWTTKELNGHFNAERKSRAGIKNGNVKLSAMQVAEIRDTLADCIVNNKRFNGSALARQYNVKPQTISKIKNGLLWK